MAAIIGALRVILGADTAAFEDGLKKASSSLQGFGKQAGAVAAGIKLEQTLTQITRAFTDWITGAINAGEELNKLSKQTGVSVEELSKLKFAAEQSDAKIEDVAKAFQILSRNMAEASVNAGSQFARALKAMDLELKETDGSLKSQSKLFSEIATKFKSYEDGAEKAALAQALFKKFGMAIIPFLNEGGEGIDKLKNRLVELGAVMGTDTAKASDQLKDTLGELKAVTDGIAIVIAKEMLPGLQMTTESLVAFASGGERARSVGEALGTMLSTAVKIFAQLVVEIQGLGILWERFLTLIRTPIFEDDNPLKGFSAAFTKAREDFNKTQAEIDLAMAKVANSFLPVQAEILSTVQRLDGLSSALILTGNAATTMAQKTLAPIVSLKEMKNAVEEFINSQQKSIAAQRAEADAVFLGTRAKAALKVEYEALAIATAKNIPVTDALRAKIEATSNAAGTAALRLEGMQLRLANQAPSEAFRMEMEKTEKAMRSIPETTAPEIERALDKIKEKFGLTWESMGKNVADFMGSMSDLTATFGKENKAMAIASKAFGISQAIINTQIAITKALATLPPPASYFAVAAAVAAGAAAVAKISMQGMAMGGTFKVPGTGGTDSMPVGFLATPGERVTVETPEQQQRGGRGAVSEVRIQGIDSRTFFRGDMLRDLIESLNAAHKDGYKLVTA